VAPIASPVETAERLLAAIAALQQSMIDHVAMAALAFDRDDMPGAQLVAGDLIGGNFKIVPHAIPSLPPAGGSYVTARSRAGFA
jgi:hypothetical protein